MQRVVIYRNYRGYVSKQLVQKWLHIMTLISDKLFMTDNVKWLKIDSIKKDESLPFTFFKESDGNFIFRLEYQRLENPSQDLINAIEFLFIQGNVQGEKHEICGDNRTMIEFESKPDLFHTKEEKQDSFLLLLQKETMLGNLSLLLEKFQIAKDCGDTSRTEKYRRQVMQQIQELNQFPSS
ncbi:hypothetical protein JOC77_000506 [Peribacillus deserti]|uniref:IDEAL domain-containing protein n=1 Tax=Peribacillus deserti TaxID=673318 RepID=A0ABS2QD61_9BACI|nr:hypothetical protein [Peribacillus deserti]MBM7691101.1 hypothetical protein [Peribacillus deserti]